MQILFLTLGFISLFLIFATAELQKSQELRVTDTIFTEHLTQNALVCAKKLKEEVQSEVKKFRRIPGSARTLSRHLHIHFLFHKKEESPHQYKDLVRRLFIKLLQSLYEQQEFFQNAVRQDPQFLEHFVQRLVEKSQLLYEEGRLESASDLAAACLNDREYQDILYKMVTGNRPRDRKKNIPLDTYYPPLSDYIAIMPHDSDQKYIAYPFLARKPVLDTIFDAQTTEHILQIRKTIWKEVSNRNSNNSAPTTNTASVDDDEDDDDDNASSKDPQVASQAQRRQQIKEQKKMQFEKECQPTIPHDIPASLLYFGVSSTEPWE